MESEPVIYGVSGLLVGRPLPSHGRGLSNYATGALKFVLENTLKLRLRLRASLPDRTQEDSKGPGFSTFSAHFQHMNLGAPSPM